MGLVMNQRLHVNGHKWRCVIVVLDIHICVVQYLVVAIGLPEEEELPFGLWDCLAPQL